MDCLKRTNFLNPISGNMQNVESCVPTRRSHSKRIKRHPFIATIFASLLLWVAPYNQSATNTDPLRVQVLGSGGPELDDGRASSSYLIWIDGKATVLVDTGTGSAVNFEKSGAQFSDLEAIAFTHLHVDHSADFPAYIKGSYFSSRSRNLLVVGPSGNMIMPSTKEFAARMIGPNGAFAYLQNFLIEGGENYPLVVRDRDIKDRKVQRISLRPGLTLSSMPVHHGPVAALAWRVDIGKYSVTFSGDMNNAYDTLQHLAEATDLLVIHNAVPESAGGAAANLHIKPLIIGQVAQHSGAKKLLISHRMNRTLGDEAKTLAAIRNSYGGPVAFANDLDSFVISGE